MRPAAVQRMVGVPLGRRGGSAHQEAACRVLLWGGRGLGLIVRPWLTLWCVGVAGMRVWALQDGESALLWAVWSGKVEAVALLLDRGADLEAKDNVSQSTAPPACCLAGVVRGRDTASCCAGLGRPATRAARPGARTGERRVGGG